MVHSEVRTQEDTSVSALALGCQVPELYWYSDQKWYV